MKAPKILYFTESYNPSVADQMAVLELGISVMFRNAQFAGQEGGIEACDGVSGAVPENYEHLPSAENAMKSYRSALKKLHSGLGETLAPNVKAPKQDTDENKDKQPDGGDNTKAPTEQNDAPAWNGGKK